MALSVPWKEVQVDDNGTIINVAVVNWTLSPLNPAIALAEMTFTTFNGNIG